MPPEPMTKPEGRDMNAGFLLRHSSHEADEQSRATGRGAGGAKAGGTKGNATRWRNCVASDSRVACP